MSVPTVLPAILDHHTPTILVQLTVGALILVDVYSRQAFKMPTTLRVGTINELIKSCPFSHPRMIISDEQSATEIFKMALNACPFVTMEEASIFVIQPQPSFISNIATCELIMMQNMIQKSGYPIIETQFLLNESIAEEDWKFLINLSQSYKHKQPKTNVNIFKRIKSWADNSL